MKRACKKHIADVVVGGCRCCGRRREKDYKGTLQMHHHKNSTYKNKTNTNIKFLKLMLTGEYQFM